VATTTGNEMEKGRILIVDDDPDITNSYSLCLEDTRLFEVEAYNDSVEALSNFKSNSYMLVILDIKMPMMNGFELYDKIKKLDSKVKVCFTSGFNINSAELGEQFTSLEIECFIPKAIHIKELVQRIEAELLR
jgi:DNA-binding response OmpR family regulator